MRNKALMKKKNDHTITERTASQPVVQWYPGHMVKAKRQMSEDIALVDLVIQVLDARAPQSSLNPDIVQLCGGKPQLLLLNKRDLASEPDTQAWLGYFRRQGFSAASLNAAQKQGVKELLATVNRAVEPVMQALENKGRLRRPVRVMIVGVPNCGKSTVINALAPQAAAKTGNKPGVTRGRQWVKTAVGVELLDTPGVLWPKFASYHTAFCLAVTGSISDQVFPVYAICEELVAWLSRKSPQSLRERYGLTELPDHPQEILTAIGRRRGLLAAGGQVRLEDAAYLFLQEFRSGKLGRFTLEEPGAVHE